MINQFFGNNATVRNMSRVEAAPIYSQNTSCQFGRSGGTQQVGLGEPGLAWVVVWYLGVRSMCGGGEMWEPDE